MLLRPCLSSGYSDGVFSHDIDSFEASLLSSIYHLKEIEAGLVR